MLIGSGKCHGCGSAIESKCILVVSMSGIYSCYIGAMLIMSLNSLGSAGVGRLYS